MVYRSNGPSLRLQLAEAAAAAGQEVNELVTRARAAAGPAAEELALPPLPHGVPLLVAELLVLDNTLRYTQAVQVALNGWPVNLGFLQQGARCIRVLWQVVNKCLQDRLPFYLIVVMMYYCTTTIVVILTDCRLCYDHIKGTHC